MLMKKINSIEFGIISPDGIRKMSALEIKSPETYDKDGFPMETGLMDPHLGVINPGLRCKTCGQKMKQCPGHFGHIELVRPVVHSEFGKKLDTLLQTTCLACGKIMLSDEKIKKLKDTAAGRVVDYSKKLLLYTKKVKKCPNCSAEKATILLDKPTNFFIEKERLYPTQIREWIEKISDEDVKLFGYNPQKIRPEWFVLRSLLVPPITIRPSITLDTGIKSEDDLTHKLVDIVRINLRLKDNIDAGAPQLIIEDLWDLLQYHITTYYDNNTAGVPPAKHRSGRALRTLVQRLKGKKGRFRYNLTGKRVNFAARSIITPDAYISINEIGVPEKIAEDLTVPEFVTEKNIDDIKKLIQETNKILYIARPTGARKKITDITKEDIIKELEPGFKVERILMDGDIVLFNRQPSLHRLSMLAHKAKIMPGQTFRMNPCVCKPYNADFDGDEMNLHVPQTEEGKTEARELMFVQNQIISPRHGGPVIILDEDGVTGAFILTLPTTKFSREEAMHIVQLAGLNQLSEPDMKKEYSGRLLFSLLLPTDLNLEYTSKTASIIANVMEGEKRDFNVLEEPVKIVNGKLVSGVIDGNSLGEVKGKLIDTLVRNYPPEVIVKFYDSMSKISEYIVTKTGLSVGLDEWSVTEDVHKVKDKFLKDQKKEAEKLVEEYEKGTMEIIPGRTLEESFEIYMMKLGAKTKNKIEKRIMLERVKPYLEGKPEFNSTTMILSGSRGSVINITNIAGFWGQASVREGRPKRGFKDRLITTNLKKDVGSEAGGFIEHNFLEGMDSIEYFYHAMGGRQGEVDTGVSTKVSGYLYRRLANTLKDLVVSSDDTVRSASKQIIQFTYGDDGIFPVNTRRGAPLNVEEELNKK